MGFLSFGTQRPSLVKFSLPGKHYSVQLMREWPNGHILVETDATNLQAAIASTDGDLSNLGVLFREAKYLLFCNLLDLHSPRSCNKVVSAFVCLLF